MLEETREILRFLAEEVSPDTYVNIMAQYRPEYQAASGRYPEIDRPITTAEYQAALRMAQDLGLWRLDQRWLW